MSVRSNPIAVKIRSEDTCAHESIFLSMDLNDWENVHSRLCHFSFERVRLSKDYVKGIDLSNCVRPKDPCPSCAIHGMRRSATPTSVRQRNFTFFGERLHSDTIWMPTKSSPFDFGYMLCFLDAATRYLAIYFMRNCDSTGPRGLRPAAGRSLNPTVL